MARVDLATVVGVNRLPHEPSLYHPSEAQHRCLKSGESGKGEWGLTIDEGLLNSLFQAKLADLKEIASAEDLPKTGNVEQLRARLIQNLVLHEIDLSDDALKNLQNEELTEILGIFGIKKSGSKKEKHQRLWLHLNADPKTLNVSQIGAASKDELHALCVSLGLKRSGDKNTLLGRVAGVLSSQEGGWGRVKKSLRTGKRSALTTSAKKVSTTESEVMAPAVESLLQPVEPPILVAEEMEGDSQSWEELPTVAEYEGETEVPLESMVTLDEGGGEALVRLQARRAELTSHLREFLLIGKEQDSDDVSAFIEDLGRLGFGIEHAVVRERILEELHQMIKLKQKEDSARGALPGSWKEKRALRQLEDERNSLLGHLDEILERCGGDIPAARIEFENRARDAGLDLEMVAISGRIHGLFDLQVSLRASEAELDPVTARRHRALEMLYRNSSEVTPEGVAQLSKVETQMEAFERVVETIVRNAEGEFGPTQHALLVRFLERRGWDANHPEVRPRLLAAAGILAAEMGYVSAEDIPALPSSISLDHEKVAEVVDSMKEVLVKMGRRVPEVDPAASSAGEESESERVKSKLDAADALLKKLNRGL